MRVLLVVKSMMMENLGVMYLSSVIKKGGHECRIVDMGFTVGNIVEWVPDIIGYSIMTGDQLRFQKINDVVLHAIKVYGNGKPKIIVGGPDPTFFPEGYDWADEICKGEGEKWMADFLLKIEEPGWVHAFPTAETLINLFPWPDRTSFPNMKVRDFITSRGCPYNTCHYCYNERWMKLFPEYEKVRIRNPKDVVDEIKSVNPEYVYFQDSVFGISMDWMKEFAKEYPKIPYQCHLRPEMVTEERVGLLKESNCVAVRMALETADEGLREMVGRKMKLETVSFASMMLKQYDIQSMMQNILALPNSTIEQDLETLEFNIKCSPTYAWSSIYVPYPGTVLGDLCKEKGWYKGNYENITDSFFAESVLEFPKEQKEQQYILWSVFDLCVRYGYLPKPEELTYKALPKLIHTITRRNGDKKLYLGLL
jgi:radical SAM superfamily enzyme YgiQ (UPF0313 family)